jgi:hypothetical protein
MGLDEVRPGRRDVSGDREMSTAALAGQARNAAAHADLTTWDLQVRAWPRPPSADDRVLVALHQTTIHVRSAADALDPPDLVTYIPSFHRRSLVVSGGVLLVGVIVAGLTLSGLTMAVVVAAHVTVVMALQATYVRWAIRRGPRRIEDAEPDVRATINTLATDINALVDVLTPGRSPRHAKADASLRTAAKWIQLARHATGRDSTTEP